MSCMTAKASKAMCDKHIDQKQFVHSNNSVVVLHKTGYYYYMYLYVKQWWLEKATFRPHSN